MMLGRTHASRCSSSRTCSSETANGPMVEVSAGILVQPRPGSSWRMDQATAIHLFGPSWHTNSGTPWLEEGMLHGGSCEVEARVTASGPRKITASSPSGSSTGSGRSRVVDRGCSTKRTQRKTAALRPSSSRCSRVASSPNCSSMLLKKSEDNRD